MIEMIDAEASADAKTEPSEEWIFMKQQTYAQLMGWA